MFQNSNIVYQQSLSGLGEWPQNGENGENFFTPNYNIVPSCCWSNKQNTQSFCQIFVFLTNILHLQYLLYFYGVGFSPEFVWSTLPKIAPKHMFRLHCVTGMLQMPIMYSTTFYIQAFHKNEKWTNVASKYVLIRHCIKIPNFIGG